MYKSKTRAHESIQQKGNEIFLGVSTLILSSIYLNPTGTFRSRISRLWSAKIARELPLSGRYPDLVRSGRRTLRNGSSLSSILYSARFTCREVTDLVVDHKHRLAVKKTRHAHHGVHLEQSHDSLAIPTAFEDRSVKELVVKKKCSVTSLEMC
ncbi:hypothetical protein PMAYCL1PPCAC_09132 [Pristionchus mayeri]|uniref:Uncharacterized protein n=1 Tax=Pristionchus mayeri TaxID=1317129 RepID=A0AAN4ZIY8_9BILA|nr:hypothetical protein PMAYCL1PPCAC_09132 [Pristionchus mayeri]